MFLLLALSSTGLRTSEEERLLQSSESVWLSRLALVAEIVYDRPRSRVPSSIPPAFLCFRSGQFNDIMALHVEIGSLVLVSVSHSPSKLRMITIVVASLFYWSFILFPLFRPTCPSRAFSTGFEPTFVSTTRLPSTPPSNSTLNVSIQSGAGTPTMSSKLASDPTAGSFFLTAKTTFLRL